MRRSGEDFMILTVKDSDPGVQLIIGEDGGNIKTIWES